MAFAAVQNPRSDNRFVYNQFFCVCGFSSKHIVSFKSQRKSFYIFEIRDETMKAGIQTSHPSESLNTTKPKILQCSNPKVFSRIFLNHGDVMGWTRGRESQVLGASSPRFGLH